MIAVRFAALLLAVALTAGVAAGQGVPPNTPPARRDVANVADYGARCDGSTDDGAAFAAAIATGKASVAVPATGGACVVTAAIVPQSGQTVSGIGGQPTIKLVSASVSRVFDLTGLTGVTVRSLTLDGSAAAAGGDFIRLLNTTNSVIDGNVINNGPGGAGGGMILVGQTSVGNRISNNKINNPAGNAAVIVNGALGQFNNIENNDFVNSAFFSVRIMSGASRNSVTNNRSYNSGIEAYAVSLGSSYNRIVGNLVEVDQDNCISIVGDHNTIANNVVKSCAAAGIYLWGSANTVTGNVGIDNGQVSGSIFPCIGGNANYGATGQNNVVTGNTCDDDQATPTQPGIQFGGTSYATWSAGASVTSGTYWMSGLNVYLAGSTGTAGATPPTCTSGTCSDGTITWTYQSTFLTSTDPYPVVSANSVIRYRATAQGAGPYAGLPLQGAHALNRNPDFLVSQVYLDAASPTTVNFGSLVIDGWRTVSTVGTKFTYQRTTTSLPNYQYAWAITSLSATAPAATDAYQVINRIEGIDIAQLKWGTATALPLTLDACINTTGITGQIPFVLDDAATAAYVTSFNVTSAGAWQCFSTTIPGPTIGAWGSVSNSMALRLSVGLGAGSSKTTSTVNQWAAGAFGAVGPTGMAQLLSTNAAVIRLAAVHLYPAGNAYVPRSYAETLTRAQRYFYSTFSQRSAPGNNAGVAGALCSVAPVAASNVSAFLKPAVSMFGTTPTITTYNPSASNANWRDVTAASDVAVSVDPASSKGQSGVLISTGATVATQGDVLCIHATIDSGS